MNEIETNLQRRGWVRDAKGNWSHPSRTKSKRVISTVRAAQDTNGKRDVCRPSVESLQRETLYPGRVSVSIVSYRRRLADPDGLLGKWFLDAARYSQLIKSDDAATITYSISQVKVATKEEEGTEIVITPL